MGFESGLYKNSATKETTTIRITLLTAETTDAPIWTILETVISSVRSEQAA